MYEVNKSSNPVALSATWNHSLLDRSRIIKKEMKGEKGGWKGRSGRVNVNAKTATSQAAREGTRPVGDNGD